MRVAPCPLTRAVSEAIEAETLAADPFLSGHLQVCQHCLDHVFGQLRRPPRSTTSSPPGRLPEREST